MMRREARAVLPLVTVCAVGAAAPAWALIPPMAQEDLVRQASSIIDGRVIKVEKVGQVTHDHCYGWQQMRALVAVEKSYKGGAEKAVWISYPTRVEDRSRCVGGQTSYSLRPRDRYRLYLSCAAPAPRGKRSRPRRCHFISWSGVTYLPPGKQDPPPPKVLQPTRTPAPTPGPVPVRAPTR